MFERLRCLAKAKGLSGQNSKSFNLTTSLLRKLVKTQRVSTSEAKLPGRPIGSELAEFQPCSFAAEG